MRKLLSAAVAAASIAVAAPAGAQQQLNVTMNFASGATFNGIVTFANDFSSVLDVEGTLNGYQYGTLGYQGSGSDTINWIWNNGLDYSSGANTYSTFLMDGPGDGYTGAPYYNWIELTYNFGSGSALTFNTSSSTLNSVQATDAMVSGSFSAVGQTSNVPEPATWAMMLFGFGAVGFQLRRKRPALLGQLA